MVALIALLAPPQEPAAFRAVFEDRPRQLIVRIANGPGDEGVYAIFSPDVCAVRKVWNGRINYRGKVYDFSQENSFGEGTALYEVPSQVLGPTDFGLRTASGDPVWRFTEVGHAVESRPFSLIHWGPLYFAFEERGDTDSVAIELSDATRQPVYQYLSSNTISGPNVWQWNYKQMPALPGRFQGQIRISAPTLKAPKDVRRARLFGDRLAWFRENQPVPVQFRGYTRQGDKTTIRFTADARPIELTMTLENGRLMMRYRATAAGPALTLHSYQPAIPDATLGEAADATAEVRA
jgi:hypothetical protein